MATAPSRHHMFQGELPRVLDGLAMQWQLGAEGGGPHVQKTPDTVLVTL